MLSIMATMSAPVLQGPMADLSCLALLTRLRHLYGPLPLPSHLFLPAFSYLLSHPCPPSPAFSLIPARLLLPSLSSLPAFPSPLTHASLSVTPTSPQHSHDSQPHGWRAAFLSLCPFFTHNPVTPFRFLESMPFLLHSQPSLPVAPCPCFTWDTAGQRTSSLCKFHLLSLPAPPVTCHLLQDVTGNFNVHRSAPFPTEWMALTGLDTLAHFLAQHPPVRPPLLPLAPPLLSHLPSSRPSPPLAPPLLSHLPSSRGTCRRAGLNGFTGSIPSTISALTALTDLGLSSNNLTGAVPATRAPLQTLHSQFSLISQLPCTKILLLPSTSPPFHIPSPPRPLPPPAPTACRDLSHNHLTNMPTAISPALASL
ncbi:unnamed protein product [Closterium sp. NIES-65]|nr:unnamed protein product [Closterium sp. NIES-65]